MNTEPRQCQKTLNNEYRSVETNRQSNYNYQMNTEPRQCQKTLNNEYRSVETNRQSNYNFQMNTESRQCQQTLNNEYRSTEINRQSNYNFQMNTESMQRPQALNNEYRSAEKSQLSNLTTESTLCQQSLNNEDTQPNPVELASHQRTITEKLFMLASTSNDSIENISETTSFQQNPCHLEQMHGVVENRNDKSALSSDKRKLSEIEVENKSEKCSKVTRIEGDEQRSTAYSVYRRNNVRNHELSKNTGVCDRNDMFDYLQMYWECQFDGIIPRQVVCNFLKVERKYTNELKVLT